MIGAHVTSQNWETAKKTSWCVKHVGGKITLISNYDRYDTTNIIH